MIEAIIHKNKFNNGIIEVYQEYIPYVDDEGFKSYKNYGLKSWKGILKLKLENIQFVNSPFNINKYFNDYDGEAYIITSLLFIELKKIYDLEFIGSGVLKYRGKII